MYMRLHALVLLTAALAADFGGIYRHDVDPSLHLRLAQQATFDPVGLVRDSAGAVIGSFVLIAPDWAITAAHVVEDRAVNDVVLELGSDRLHVVNIIVHPEYRGARYADHAEAIFRKGIDAALVRLSRPYGDVAPVRLYSGRDELGRRATLVGFGTSGDAIEAIRNPHPSGTKLAGHNDIDQIGGSVAGRPIPDWYLVSDFDHPSNEELSRTASARPLPLEFLMAGGDSGGGLFVQDDGGWVLAGINVTARIALNDSVERDGVYGSLNLSVRIAHVRDWITSVIAHASS